MIKRFGVSIDENLLDRFDELIREEGYRSRSGAIEDLIREKILEKGVESGVEDRVGVITAVYDHSSISAVRELLYIQHEFERVYATMHIHLDGERCLEVIAVEGDPQRIGNLGNRIRSIKGVAHSKLMYAC
jgi:CopG family nickel-responsive transcriptional regulator